MGFKEDEDSIVYFIYFYSIRLCIRQKNYTGLRKDNL